MMGTAPLAYRQKAEAQFGTVGSDNQYVDLLEDEAGFVWIGVHFGSRGLGHTSATKYLKAAGGRDGTHVPPTVVTEESELGRRYIAAMEQAGRYAYAGREWVVERVRRIIGGAVTDSVHNHHNYTWRETHGSRDLWVVRKGATPAFPGQRGFVGGSMGDDAVILEGVQTPEAASALYSTVHGAGGVFGRREAFRRFSARRWRPGCAAAACWSRAGISTRARWPIAPARGAGAARRHGEGPAPAPPLRGGEGGPGAARPFRGPRPVRAGAGPAPLAFPAGRFRG